MMRVGVLHGGLELEVDKLKAIPPSQKLQILENQSVESIPHYTGARTAPSHPFAATPVLSPTTSPLDSPVSSARSSPPPQTPEMNATPTSTARASKGGVEDIDVLKLDGEKL